VACALALLWRQEGSTKVIHQNPEHPLQSGTVTATNDELDLVMRLVPKVPFDVAVRWLDMSNPALDGRTPAEALQAGEQAAVLLASEGWASAP